MKKITLFILALLVSVSGVSFAGVQIDRGQTRGQTGAVSTFFVARNGRVAGISADRVVIWDTTSADGVSVTTSTTSRDSLVAGVTIDAIPGVTSDSTAAANLTGGNWGRVQTYGFHSSVSFDTGAVACTAGTLVGQSNVAGRATVFEPISDDGVALQYPASSSDSFGVTVEACAAGNSTIDVQI